MGDSFSFIDMHSSLTNHIRKEQYGYLTSYSPWRFTEFSNIGKYFTEYADCGYEK
jgi:hypothetical protein